MLISCATHKNGSSCFLRFCSFILLGTSIRYGRRNDLRPHLIGHGFPLILLFVRIIEVPILSLTSFHLSLSLKSFKEDQMINHFVLFTSKPSFCGFDLNSEFFWNANLWLEIISSLLYFLLSSWSSLLLSSSLIFAIVAVVVVIISFECETKC